MKITVSPPATPKPLLVTDIKPGEVFSYVTNPAMVYIKTSDGGITDLGYGNHFIDGRVCRFTEVKLHTNAVCTL
jgi:hypothetical protein